MKGPSIRGTLRVLDLGYAAILAIAILGFNRGFYHDDAYITLRYAKNLISGHGAVWNPGEYVQGYTDFLHMILISLLGRLGIDLALASRLIGLAAFVGVAAALLLFFRFAVRRDGDWILWRLPVILVLTSTPMLAWSVGGLEGTLFSFFVLAGCLLFILPAASSYGWRLYAATGVLLGLGFLTRPDGFIFIAVSFIWILATWKSQGRPGLCLIAFTASVAIVALPYIVWQFYYYGSVIPNPFYAKTGSPPLLRLQSGSRYIIDYALRPPYLPLLVLASLAIALLKKEWNSKLTFLTASVVAYMTFIVVAGGDHMPTFRLLLPVVAPMGLVLSLALAPVTRGRGRPATVLITLVVLVLSSLQLLSGKLNPRGIDSAARVGTIVGKYISDAWPAGSLVALNTAGSTPYFASQHRYIDMLGLNDAHIARRRINNIELPLQRLPGHSKGNGAYVLSRQPDFIIPGPAAGCLLSKKPWFLSDLELTRDPRFRREYLPVQVLLDLSGRRTEGRGVIFTYYQRVASESR
jgi:arabinofuranosyltransferase